MGGLATNPEELTQIKMFAQRGYRTSAIAKKLGRSSTFVHNKLTAINNGTLIVAPAAQDVAPFTPPSEPGLKAAIRIIIATQLTDAQKLNVIAALV